MIRRLAAALCALGAWGAFGEQYDRPYALIEPADRSPTREEFPPAITQIDGESTRNPRKPDPVAPGKHRVTVRFETARATQAPQDATRDLDMELQPCTRYRIAARRVGAARWEPRVYSEAIAECQSKFAKK